MKDAHIDKLHGTDVADPFRWLEDDVRESTAVADWVAAQNAATNAWLGDIGERDAIAARLRELWDFERFGLPLRRGERYFFEYNDGLRNQNTLQMQAGPGAEPALLIDPNEWADDATVALAEWFPDPHGQHVAYLVQDGGSDWRTVRVLDVDTDMVLDDRLEWLKFTGLSWAADGSGFYYSRYPAPGEDRKFQALNRDQAVYFHRLGDSQSSDTLVYERPDHPEWGFAPTVTEDGRHLVITIWAGTDARYQVAVQDLDDAAARPAMLIEGFEHDYALVGSRGTTLFFRTTRDAPRGRLVAIDVASPGKESLREIVPEADDVLLQVSLVGGYFIALYMQDARSVVRRYTEDGTLAGNVDLPGPGTAYGFVGREADAEAFFGYTSFNVPDTVNRLDVATGEVSVFRQPDVKFDPDDYVVEQVFFTSKDGTRVPMFITHRRDVIRDGSNPTVLYGYGGFNISLQPDFSPARMGWLEMGGIWAAANLRGGGEYGEAWHEAGTRLNKQNVFDDFIAAAEYLVERRYTSSRKLAIFGGSNGGLLVGAVTNQRPDLFAAALPAVGVMDMLRFHHFTAGRFWVDDYGSADDPAEFRALLAYSPYHNIRPGTEYPAVLITTADTDDRVVPGHSFKYAAALQAAQAGNEPVLIRIETRAGHGAGTPTDKAIAEYADRWGFLVRTLRMQLPPGFGKR
ncbi:MAG: prolyl oligopeptidase family serine peptidase [Woeseiaceae bacterium]|nr:prolyl oligopeptidase family serine peptidase [Woeseiaceae bacterium]